MGRYDTSRYRVAPLSTSLGADGRLGEGFPPGMTVDELRWYSRRRPNDSQKRDNICLEAGSLKDVSSEYRYSFQAPQFVARSLGDLASHVESEKENLNIRRCSSHSEDLVGKSIVRSRFRPKEYLRPEGDMIFETENADKFIEYILSKRPDLLRRNTQLKLEGDLETRTENKDQFITFDSYCTRPPLAKRDTNLHLEGDFLHFPEYKEVFVDFPRHRPISIKPNPWLHVDTEEKMDTFSETHDKFIQYSNLTGLKPELLKRPTNLKYENGFELIPEYKDSFKEFPIEKRSSIKQNSCLRLEGELYTTPEYKDKYVPLPLMKNEPSKHPDSLILDETFTPSVQNNDIAYVPSNTNSQNVLTKSEENLPVSTDNRETSPKSTYPRKTETSNNPNETKQKSEDHKKRLTDISHKAIPLASHESTVTARPPKGRRSRTTSITSTSSLRRQEIAPTEQILRTERRDSVENKFVDYPNISYQRKLKSPDMNPGDNKFECQPEYRKAYVDYLIRERLPRSRSPDKVLEKPPLNLKWLKRGDSSNPSFDIVRQNKSYGGSKNVSYDSPTYKPSSRRGSVTSITGGSPRRSESPTYKLQVTNVDEPKRGFGSRSYKKGLSEYTMSRSNSPSRQMKINEPIQSNVVLRERSRRQWQRNTNFDYDEPRNNSFVVLEKSRQPQHVTKWNSPWYKYPDE